MDDLGQLRPHTGGFSDWNLLAHRSAAPCGGHAVRGLERLKFVTPFHNFNYTAVSRSETEPLPTASNPPRTDLEDSDDDEGVSSESECRLLLDEMIGLNNPAQRFIARPAIICWLLGSVILSMTSTWLVYGSMVPPYAVLLAVLLVFPLSIVSLRALGETDVAPVESISTCYLLDFASLQHCVH